MSLGTTLNEAKFNREFRSMASERQTLGADLTWSGGKWNSPLARLDYLLHRSFVPLINRERVLRPYALFWLARANIVLAFAQTQHLLAWKSKTAVRRGEEAFSRIDLPSAPAPAA
jgi:hypothetical protein